MASQKEIALRTRILEQLPVNERREYPNLQLAVDLGLGDYPIRAIRKALYALQEKGKLHVTRGEPISVGNADDIIRIRRRPQE
jgi:hypothetical protein